jgi:hypothetical protein
MLLGAILLFIAAILAYPAVKLAKAKRRRNKLRKDYESRYNGFHLGEMTGHDVRTKYSQRKDPARKEGTKNEKAKD